MKVLISGAGIAGPALAYWLARYGDEVTIVEEAPRLRTGGYIIDFWGAGFEIADRMGLVPELKAAGYKVREVRVVNDRGERVAGFSADSLTRATNGRFVSIPRGDLASLIFSKIRGGVETIFGDSISRIVQTTTCARVTFESGVQREFDIVVGADGLHSRVRSLVFGGERQFEKYLGYRVAAFETEGYRPRDELAYLMYTQVHQQVSRFAMRGDRTMFLFTFAAPDTVVEDVAAQKALLRRRFGSSGWECPRILRALDETGDLYFDRVSQIRMDRWDHGRVVLLGDAAFCVSLLAGQGSALAMTAAYILAGELHRAAGDHSRAFARYQEIFGPFVGGKQKAALRLAGFFAPKSRASLFLRNQVMNLMSISWVSDYVFARDLKDSIALPAYEAGTPVEFHV